MIILSGVLVVVAIALLVTGIATGNSGTEFLHLDGLKLIYISIAISIVSALCLAVGVVLRRKELFGSPAPKSATAKSQAKAERTAAKATKPARAKAKAGVTGAATTMPSPGAAADVPAETAVFVVPGRKRYHLETCRQLAGREREELTFEEAREEGFTPCTACLPDTALAARAAIADSSADEDARPDETPASETRTDLPAFDVEEGVGARFAGSDVKAIPPSTPTVPVPVAEDEASPLYDALATRETGSVFDSPAAEESVHTEETSAGEETGSAFDSPGSSHGSIFEPAAKSGSVFDAPADAEAKDEEADHAAEAHAQEEDTAVEAADEPDAAGDTETTQHIAVVADDTNEDTVTPGTEAEAPVVEAAAAGKSVVEAAAAGKSSVTAETGAADAEGEVAPASVAESGDEAEPVGEAAAAAPDEKADADQAPVRILSGTKRYHRPDCALIEDIGEDADDLESLSRSAAKERGCTPCLVCQPDKEPDARD